MDLKHDRIAYHSDGQGYGSLIQRKNDIRESLSTTDQAEAFEEAPVQRWRWLRPLLPKWLHHICGWRKQPELRKLSS